MTNDILVIGNGFLGSEFARHGAVVVGRNGFSFNLTDDYETISEKLNYLFDMYGHTPSVLVNCIGQANTRKCEVPENWTSTLGVNGWLPMALTQYCQDHKIKFVHISTGCLYDSTNGKQTEDTATATHCRYTVSKAVGEYGLNPVRDLIIRPRLLFSDVQSSMNLLSKVHRFNGTFVNEFNSITSTRTIVEAVEALLKAQVAGVFNVANDGAYTLCDIAEACGFEVKKRLTGSQLAAQEGLCLVNNVMDLTKLKKYYTPRDAIQEAKQMWKTLTKEKNNG